MPPQSILLLVGSKNPHKVLEIRRMLAGVPVEVTDLSAFDVPDIKEDGDTFEANAVLKASVFAKETGLLTVSDDSGLEVDALGGAPGVYSARFAGEPGDDEANNALVLERLAGVPDEKRTARFRCVIALASPAGLLFTTEGHVEGKIAHGEHGDYGFGYDPLFIPEGYNNTFGELGRQVKDSISHRARALAAFMERFGEYIGRAGE